MVGSAAPAAAAAAGDSAGAGAGAAAGGSAGGGGGVVAAPAAFLGWLTAQIQPPGCVLLARAPVSCNRQVLPHAGGRL